MAHRAVGARRERLVMNGMAPAAIPEGVTWRLKARETGGLIDLPRPPKFRAGDRLRVTRGPFAGPRRPLCRA